MSLTFLPVPAIGDVAAGADLAALIGDALVAAGLALHSGDVIVVAQKIVSKAEDRFVDMAMVEPSAEAIALAASTLKDPRVVELILQESEEVVRSKPHVLVVAHRKGYVMAHAGIDRSNVGDPNDGEQVLLLPEDCDASARQLRNRLSERFGAKIAVVVSDSFGRAWRKGTVNIALGVAGMPAIVDRRGEQDRYGYILEHTEIALADAVAAGAGLAMGEAAEGMPVVLVRGVRWNAPDGTGQSLLRPKAEDMFR